MVPEIILGAGAFKSSHSTTCRVQDEMCRVQDEMCVPSLIVCCLICKCAFGIDKFCDKVFNSSYFSLKCIARIWIPLFPNRDRSRGSRTEFGGPCPSHVQDISAIAKYQTTRPSGLVSKDNESSATLESRLQGNITVSYHMCIHFIKGKNSTPSSWHLVSFRFVAFLRFSGGFVFFIQYGHSRHPQLHYHFVTFSEFWLVAPLQLGLLPPGSNL